jgi:hypothetical protein
MLVICNFWFIRIRKKEGAGAVYSGKLKVVCLGLVIRKRWDESYYSTPAGDENEHDDVILGFDR